LGGGVIITEKNSYPGLFNLFSSFAWSRIGGYLFWLKRLDKTLYCFNKCVELNPYNARYWVYKGVILYKLERFDEALDSYDEALELKIPRSGRRLKVLILNNKGHALFMLERFDEALDSFNEALELKIPRSGRRLKSLILNNKGQALFLCWNVMMKL